jgi:hypothetical protein
MIFFIPARTIIQRSAPPDKRTRVIAAFGAVVVSSVMVGNLIMGIAAKLLGAPWYSLELVSVLSWRLSGS